MRLFVPFCQYELLMPFFIWRPFNCVRQDSVYVSEILQSVGFRLWKLKDGESLT